MFLVLEHYDLFMSFGLMGDDGLNSLSLLIEVCRLTALGWV